MNKNFSKIIKDAKTFSLSENDKKSVMDKVSKFIKEHPVSDAPREILTPEVGDKIKTPYLKSSLPIFSLFNKYKFISLALIIAFVLSGGTSFAANYSLPGDILYPVKIHVNENIKSFVAFSYDAEAKVEIQKADERLKEQEALALKGEVDEETKAQIRANFLKHEEKVKKIIERVKEGGDIETAGKITSRFEGVFKSHKDAASSIGLMGISTDDTNHKDDNDSDDHGEVKPVDSTGINPTLKPSPAISPIPSTGTDNDGDDKSDSDREATQLIEINSNIKTDINTSIKIDS